jgi:xanthine dehydrogenase accessory factor
MQNLITIALEELRNGNSVEWVTIVRASGSIPRGAGSRILVLSDGNFHGTIGGGKLEYEAYKLAHSLLLQAESQLKEYTLEAKMASELGMVCGGNETVYLQYMEPTTENIELCEAIEHACRQNTRYWLSTKISEQNGQSWEMQVLSQPIDKIPVENGVNPYPYYGKLDGETYFVENLTHPGTVYVFGGGHVAQALVPVLSRVEFSCVVLDDREEFASEELFPTASKVVVCDFKKLEESVDITANDYVVIMTRGHLCDFDAQEFSLRRHPYYVGVMGSRKKIAFVTKKLLETGIPLEDIQSCHMPIGTDIGAETPDELAISVAGELIAMRAKKRKEA